MSARRPRLIHPAWLTILAVCLRISLAEAQVNLGGFVGFHSPTADMKGPKTLGVFSGDIKPNTALVFGGQARLWLGSRFGLEASLAHGSSDVVFASLLGDSAIAGNVTIGTLSALVRVPLGDLPNPVWVAGGAVLIKHGGRAWRGVSGTSDLGATLGLGTQFSISGPLTVDLGFQSMFYSVALETDTGKLPSAFQIDISGRAGLSIRLGRDRAFE